MSLTTAEQALALVQSASLNVNDIKLSGAGKAFQSVAQSAAIAVQDATDYLRNISTICTTAFGVFMAKFASTGDIQMLINAILAMIPVLVAGLEFAAIGVFADVVMELFASAL